VIVVPQRLKFNIFSVQVTKRTANTCITGLLSRGSPQANDGTRVYMVAALMLAGSSIENFI
jgi:hypothetical protein